MTSLLQALFRAQNEMGLPFLVWERDWGDPSASYQDGDKGAVYGVPFVSKRVL